MKEKVYLQLGSNVEDRFDYLLDAIVEIESNFGRILKASNIYETKAWGKTLQADFLNQVIMVETSKKPLNILSIVNEIEDKLGRVRLEKWGQRTLDIDILFIGIDIIRSNKLSIPHPLISKRRFVLAPLAEIAGDFIHPVLNKSIFQLLDECDDRLDANIWLPKK